MTHRCKAARLAIGVLFFIISLVTMTATPAYADDPDPNFTIPFSEADMELGESKIWDIPVTAPTVMPKVDIVFVYDTTGSMSSRKSWVTAAISQLTSDLMSAGAHSIHWGAYYFGDLAANDSYGLTLQLGEWTAAQVSTAVSSLPSTGGADLPEDSIFALLDAGTKADWREDAQKIMILFTDTGIKIRNYMTVESYTVNVSGLQQMLSDKGITVSAQALSDNKSVSVTTSPDPSLGVTAITMETLCSALGITYYNSANQTTLRNNMSLALVGDSGKEWVYTYAITYEYLSDGTPSTDLAVSIAPTTFTLHSGEENQFAITAQATATPNRYGDVTVATIRYYVNGTLISGSEQKLYLIVQSLHLRQVVMADHNQLVVPAEGYTVLNNSISSSIADQTSSSYVTVPSGKETDTIGYRFMLLPIEVKYLLIDAVVPSYYQYLGYTLSTVDTVHLSSSMVTGQPVLNYSSDKEYWVTLYLSPTVGASESPRLYSWDYRLNDLGRIIF